MKPEIKEKWVKALRSGRYKQGRGRLLRRMARGDYHCCLGVLCAVTRRDPQGWSLSPTLRKKFGLRSEQTAALERMNDDDGKTFREIADYIEANL